jgi:hypothetical protein
VFVTAFGAFLAAAVTKDIGEGKGYFSPATRMKAALRATAEGWRISGRVPAGGTAEYDALFNDYVRAKGDGRAFEGWGFRARHARARILSRVAG